MTGPSITSQLNYLAGTPGREIARLIRGTPLECAEAALVIQVIDAAARDLCADPGRAAHSHGEHGNERIRSAAKFFGLPTFRWYCSLLDLDSGWVRRMAFEAAAQVATVRQGKRAA